MIRYLIMAGDPDVCPVAEIEESGTLPRPKESLIGNRMREKLEASALACYNTGMEAAK